MAIRMLAPSSSEDEDESYVAHNHQQPDRADSTSLASTVTDRQYLPGQLSGDSRSLQLPPISSNASLRSLLTPASSEPSTRVASAAQVRPMSPSPSVTSEPLAQQHGQQRVANSLHSQDSKDMDAMERAEKEEEERKRRLQLYVFVSRCVAYPFNAKQPTDMTRRPFKMNKQQLQLTKERFQAFLNGDTQIAADEAFINSIKHYMETFLKTDSCTRIVHSGGCSSNDFREIFKKMIEKRIRSLPEIDGLSKDTVMNSWLIKFDTIFRGDDDQRKGMRQTQNAASASELILNKDQLYDVFQHILGIKKFEHQLLFNALQLENSDEQAAAIRRELDGQMQKVNSMEKNRKLLPKFVVKEMESLFLEELRSGINLLMANLESLPVSKGATDSKYGLRKFGRYNNSFRRSRRGTNSSINKHESSDSGDSALNKLDVVLSFNIEIIVQEVQGLKIIAPNRIIFCTMEVEGGEKLQTDQTEVSKPHWDTQGDFTTTHPLPVVKVKLYAESNSVFSLSNQELGRIVVRPVPNTNRNAEWNKLEVPKNCPDQNLKMKITLRMDRPQNMKCCGQLYALGKQVWKKWKKRFMVLVQVSQYTFAMCSYKEKKSDPTEMTTLDGYTVDYTEPLQDYEGGKHFFSAVKEGDTLMFASDDENERHLWVQAMYRATGQAHRPQAPASLTITNTKAPANSPLSRLQGDADRARKHGMDEYIQADPCQFDHAALFKTLQTLTLDYRLNDLFASLGWFSPGQLFVLDEYCARYGVRGCHRHLCYLDGLLERSEKAVAIDPTLVHYSFAFCASHVHGNRPDGIGTVILAEKEKFDEIKERLRHLLEFQITNFRFCFPMGRPEGALKASLSLLERVLMKDIVTPVPPEEVRCVIKKCLETAALVNYTKLSAQAKMETDGEHRGAVNHYENHQHDGPPIRKIEDILHLSELCTDMLQQNEEYYAEEFKSAFPWLNELLIEHSEIFWSLFAVDLEVVISAQPPDTWNAFPVFQVLNDHLIHHPSMAGGRFHQQLKDMFAPLVVRYVDLMESSIAQSIHKNFEKEQWKPHGHGCAASEDMLWKLDALQTFISDLHWPDEVFAKHLEQRLKLMAADMIESCVKRTLEAYEAWMQRAKKSTDFVIPGEICVMINVVLHFKSESLKLCAVAGVDRHQYHTKIDEFIERISHEMIRSLVEKFTAILDTVLQKLSRYDEGTLLAPIFSFAKQTTSGTSSGDLGREYVNCLRSSMEQIRQKVIDELFILAMFEKLYTSQMTMICNWLTERVDRALHSYQVNCLSFLIKKTFAEYELQGIPEDVLNFKNYQTVQNRMRLEEATAAVSEASSATRSPRSAMGMFEKAKKMALS